MMMMLIMTRRPAHATQDVIKGLFEGLKSVTDENDDECVMTLKITTTVVTV